VSSDSMRQALVPGMVVGGIIGTAVVIFGPTLKTGPPQLPEPPLVGELQDFAQQYLPLLLLLLPGFWLLYLGIFAGMVLPIVNVQLGRTNHPIGRWLFPRQTGRTNRLFGRWFVPLALLWVGPVSLGTGLALVIGSAINGDVFGAAIVPVVTLIPAALLWFWPSLRPGPLKLILTRRWLATRLATDPPRWWLGCLFFGGLVSFYAAARHESPFYSGPVVIAGMVFLMAGVSLAYAWLALWLVQLTLALAGKERPLADESCGLPRHSA